MLTKVRRERKNKCKNELILCISAGHQGVKFFISIQFSESGSRTISKERFRKIRTNLKKRMKYILPNDRIFMCQLQIKCKRETERQKQSKKTSLFKNIHYN